MELRKWSGEIRCIAEEWRDRSCGWNDGWNCGLRNGMYKTIERMGTFAETYGECCGCI